MSAANITVLGSINMDLVVRCPQLPQPGQTLIADSSVEICGGKGANQAVAAARAGGQVTMIGRVGSDAFADRLIDNLRKEGVHDRQIQSTAGCASGIAIVAVEHSGENSILVVPGANGRVSIDDVRAAAPVIAASQTLLLQLEIPVESVAEAIHVAAEAGVRTILDPAPVMPDFPAEILNVDLVCPNESEASAIVGFDVRSENNLQAAAAVLHERGAKNVVITLGSRGTFLSDRNQCEHIAPFPVRAVDTTAAGDAFAGALAVYWSEGRALRDAAVLASAAGALAASREGAQPGMARRQEIEDFAALVGNHR